MATYKYEVTFKQNGVQTYEHVRAYDQEDAIQQIRSSQEGDIFIVSASRIGN